ncbi:MAG: hypothetical protein J6U14_10040 [Bacteroidaceae bacterium]|nr:hypothetical protein [Bacteroidaceae bacterium]
MKQRIRLTESDLHRIVKESVNRILTELDWKTYQNAARKSDARAWDNYDDENAFDYNMNRRGKFAKAAEDAFNRQYPRQKGRLSHEPDAMGYEGNTAYYKGPFYDYDFTGLGDGLDFTIKKKFHGGIPSKAEDDVYNYARGTSKYTPGKGWE